jgi:hypothetical protein
MLFHQVDCRDWAFPHSGCVTLLSRPVARVLGFLWTMELP